ncbi:hypothetical protein C7444_10714 [Sphaerotilus hippei]|uniref:Uncharacterized protein n=1 Tax=Sphaerotilus hippei TaxID=744406 RepID=A0A318H0D5_9BURK|nr:hypothetical protein [Sphaerotilus hippei]PXW96108.1 hypothetical protein C7444_10714 [Sphaerotilus hippei]
MATKKPQGEFQSPGTESEAPASSDDLSGFESPDQGEDAMSAEASEAEVGTWVSGVDSQILGVKTELEKLLVSMSGESTGARSQSELEANIVGVGIGMGDGTSVAASGGAPGDPVLEVYTLEPASAAETRARLASVAGIAALADSDFPILSVHTGAIDAQPHRMRLRAAPGGISCGHHAITAGTLGCLVRGRSAPRSNRLMVLSNNHVLANTNGGPLGAAILQPGPYDGGRHPADQIAILERYVPINFAAGASNRVDCATGWAWADRVRRELMYVSGGVVRYFRVGATPVAPQVGMPVGKSGRTTQLTSGRITAVGVTINVNYGSGRVAHFVNQIAVRAASGDFSAGGDSGSLIWTWDARRAPVALLFAGGGGTTFASLIGTTLAALDVQLVV